MADDPKKRGAADRRTVSKQTHELHVVADKLDVSYQAVLGAKRAVGNNRQKVEAYIRQQKKDGAYK